MIEAIPLPSESVILIITKVEDPEELDTRFARFAPARGGDGHDGSPFVPPMEGADDILDLFNKIREAHQKLAAEQPESLELPPDKEEKKDQEAGKAQAPINLTRLYRFRNLDAVIQASAVLSPIYHGENSLYKNGIAKEYHLLVNKSDHSPEEFNKICNILSEYGSSQKSSSGKDAFYAEHMECLIPSDALEKLSGLAAVTK
jgi:adapter protein MecA 1/2